MEKVRFAYALLPCGLSVADVDGDEKVRRHLARRTVDMIAELDGTAMVELDLPIRPELLNLETVAALVDLEGLGSDIDGGNEHRVLVDQ